ncbi:alpha-amylase family glycosyl hydrolase [Niameybacter massiliensis]|uniref:Alpha-amylase family glycosyl hydrolase n=1 Tax=Holtiella tumoricola TaxID=3018743 RepID=A0AA42DRL7_9FIRM|nr:MULTISPECIES: alpha-amylase family glycosyl hydrolase [Lachnospirales]MDA3733678.1 alpha-amylase family glycosyl hydrolase [Holtiella tumoricola]
MFEIEKGFPLLGCKLIRDRCNFGIYATTARCMILKIYRFVYEEVPLVEVILDRETSCMGDVFCISIKGVEEGFAYTWQTVTEKGEMSIPLIDPYARSLSAFPKGSNHYKNIVVNDKVYKGERPFIPWEETIIYEMHVGAFTKSPTSQIENRERGTFEGLLKKLPYLKELGVTSLELMPIFKWNKHTLSNKHPITQETLQDEWGYNSISFFALQEVYAMDRGALGEVKEFRKFVEAIHQNGMEVILDVVYNHTGEGGQDGKVFNFKALAPEVYYKWNGSYHRNDAGTGNTLNNKHIVTKQLILDSLRYWVVCMGIDGFRFDLASILMQNEVGNWYAGSIMEDIANDPILSHVKLIAECWDAKGAYDVGRMPYPIAEWSDCYRDTMRRFVRGDQGMTNAVAKCLTGSEIQFQDTRKNKTHTIQFITAHDGFTMWDLVSYQYKQNRLNGEGNRDGNNNNYSYNCGEEGETQNEKIISIRKKRIKNYFALLLLSQGIPMLLMGDELGRSQKGNNNAFCQDNEVTWVDWSLTEKNKEILEFVKSMIKFRKESNCFKAINKEQLKITFHGVNYNEPDWSYYSCSLAEQIEVGSEKLYIMMNNYIEPLVFDLPKQEQGWQLIIDTSQSQSFIGCHLKVQETRYCMNPFTICVFRCCTK